MKFVGTAELIAQDLNIRLFDSYIRSSVVVSEAQSVQNNVLDYAPRSSIAKDYLQFRDELLAKGV